MIEEFNKIQIMPKVRLTRVILALVRSFVLIFISFYFINSFILLFNFFIWSTILNYFYLIYIYFSVIIYFYLSSFLSSSIMFLPPHNPYGDILNLNNLSYVQIPTSVVNELHRNL